jgi:phospholipid-translocating ATPase
MEDCKRFVRDRSYNLEKFTRIMLDGSKVDVSSQDLRPGHIVYIRKGKRVPADCVILSTTDRTGSVFIRTDQLDGETDWKLRVAIQ